jgi:mercuric ion binding protein
MMLFLGLAFRKLYLVPQVCTPGTPCADPRTRQRQRLTFWIVTVLLLGLLAVPWFAPLFYWKGDSMRKLLIALLAAIPLAVLAATPKTVTLAVQNMTCELCPITVKKSLEKVPGVSAVKVDFDRKTAIVTYDADKAQPEALTKATTNAGYPSTVQK